MEVCINITIDTNHQLELDFLQWYSKCNHNKEFYRIKEALLTGYFITENGINEYYKSKFETELKDVCDNDVLCKIRNIENEKKEITSKHNEDIILYENKVNNLKKMNEELQIVIDSINNKHKEHNDKIKQEIEDYFELKRQKELSLITLEKDTICKNLQYKIDCLVDEVNTLKDNQQEKNNDIIQNIVNKHEVETKLLYEKNDVVMKQLEYFKSLSENKDNQLRDAFKNETKDKIVQLEKVLQQKETEIATLKTCNFVKGATGENIIINLLREYYPKNIIQHTGKSAHEGDIQMIDSFDETLIVIESKYKQSIDKNDVDKFCRDVSTVSQKETSTRCIGGLFVSLLTRNIPGKGDAYFEMIGNIPVMYVGFSGLDEFNIYFKKYLDMFSELCKFYLNQGVQKSNIDEVLEEMNFYFNLLIKNKTRIEDFKTSCLTKINKFVCDIETDNKVILNRLEDMLKKNNSLKFKNMNACERCGEIFSNKRLLTKHVKTCGENIIH
jgi:hypothetical protein